MTSDELTLLDYFAARETTLPDPGMTTRSAANLADVPEKDYNHALHWPRVVATHRYKMAVAMRRAKWDLEDSDAVGN